MRQFRIIAALMTISVIALGQDRNTINELVGAEKNLKQALLQADWKTADKFYGDDLIFTNADGSITHKSDDVHGIKSGDTRFSIVEMFEVQVQDFGDVGVSTGQLFEKGRYKGVDFKRTYRFTDVWARRHGQWQLVAAQETPSAPAQRPAL